MKEVNQIMEAYVGIVRSNTRLIRAWNRLDILYEETEKLFKRCKASRELCELRNMINVGYLITRQAMERKESRGLHYTIPPRRSKPPLQAGLSIDNSNPSPQSFIMTGARD